MRDGRERPSDRMLRDLMAALAEDGDEPAGVDVRFDAARAERKGVPEIVLAEGKPAELVLAAVGLARARRDRVVVSRVTGPLVEALRAARPSDDVRHSLGSWTAIVARPGSLPSQTGGRVAVLTAGTSDLPAAHEARIVAEEMGCRVEVVADVGVAGLHRLFRPLRRVLDGGVDAVIVAAGMDGALPSVVAGLLPVPVIGLPTSIGYGFGGQGEAALMSMLQTCAPGLSVVNIDNAVGAGAAAAMIANAVARARDDR